MLLARRISMSLAIVSLIAAPASFGEENSKFERGITLPQIAPAVSPPVLKAEAKGKDAPCVKMTVTIKANPNNVWKAIQHQRTSDGGKRKLVSYDGHNAVIEEKFGALPIVGAATCTYTEHESVPDERIDYEFNSSDRFREFAGHWILHQGKNGETTVELTNSLDPGIRVPFWQDITKMAASRNVKHRLEEVGSYAENLQKEQRDSKASGKEESLKTSSVSCGI